MSAAVPRLFSRTLLAPRVFARTVSSTPAVRNSAAPTSQTDNDYSALTTRDLRNLLKERKLKAHGNKTQLIKRLITAEKRGATTEATPVAPKSSAPPTPSATANSTPSEPVPAKPQSPKPSYAEAKESSKADVNAQSEGAPKIQSEPPKQAERPAPAAPAPKSTAPPAPAATASSTPAEPAPAKPTSPAPGYTEARASSTAPTKSVPNYTITPLRVPKPWELHIASESPAPVPYLPDNHLAPYHRGTTSSGVTPTSSRNPAINVVDGTASGKVQTGAEGTEPTWGGVLAALGVEGKGEGKKKIERTGTIFTQEEIDFTEGKQRGMQLATVAAGTWVLLGEGVMRAAGII